jgi:hypothetical protein
MLQLIFYMLLMALKCKIVLLLKTDKTGHVYFVSSLYIVDTHPVIKTAQL